ncbi:hypothetical protein BH11PLA2_BH11PLA2_48430 [soil metagenome]
MRTSTTQPGVDVPLKSYDGVSPTCSTTAPKAVEESPCRHATTLKEMRTPWSTCWRSSRRFLSARCSPAVKRCLLRHPDYHLHFIPTSSSWLNQIERLFAEITEKRIRRGVFKKCSGPRESNRGLPCKPQRRRKALRLGRRCRLHPGSQQKRFANELPTQDTNVIVYQKHFISRYIS